MAVEQQAGVPDGWEVVHPTTTAAEPAQTPVGFGLGIKPEIAALAAKLDAQAAKNAERDANAPADYASRLPRPLQAPVAAGLSMVQPAAEIAGILQGAPAALRAGRAATSLLSHPADVLIDTLLKKIGHDPDALELAATKMKLQAARSQTRQGKIAADIAAKTAAQTAAPTASPVEPVASAPAAPAPVVAAPVPGAPPVPPAVPPSPESGPVAPSPAAPSPAAAALPDQRALNEAALAVRRQAYQERLKAQTSAQVAETAPAAAPAAAGTVKLSAAETKAFLDLMKRGMSGPDAMKNVLLQRSLVDTLGAPTPTAAQTRFPKGQRGKVTS
jgi:hypothetical protein